MSEVRDAATRVHNGTGSTDDRKLTIEAALHYADLHVVLGEMFGPDAEQSLQVEVGKAVQAYIEKVAMRGGPHDVRQLGEAALAPLLDRLNEALTADAGGGS